MINIYKGGNKFLKVVIIFLLSTVVCALSYYFHDTPELDVAISHLFYFPVVLAAFWWGRKGIAFSVFIAALLIIGHLFLSPDISILSSLISAVMFIIIAITTSDLSETLSERKTKLEASENKYRMLTENSLTGIFIHQGEKIAYANRRFAEIHGYTIDELKCIPHIQLVHPEDREEMRERTRRRALGEDVPDEYEVRVVKKNGDTVWCRMLALRTEYENHSAIMGNVIDITQLKLAEERLRHTLKELQDTQEMLIQSETQSAIGQLAAGMAHEILNPVNIISMKMQMLEITGGCPREVLEEMGSCRVQLDRITNIAKNIRHFSNIGDGQKEVCDLNSLVERVLDLCDSQIRVLSIVKEVNCGSDLPEIFMYAERVEQAILNVISNAIFAMKNSEKKILKVETKLEPSAENPEYIRLKISDTGPGIKRENLRKIFEPFYTTRQVGEGTGLGLYVSYSIVKGHGGRMWAENNQNGGASFIFEFPLNQKP